jgi:hypothetical protein
MRPRPMAVTVAARGTHGSNRATDPHMSQSEARPPWLPEARTAATLQQPHTCPCQRLISSLEACTAAILPPQPHTCPSQRHGHRSCQRHARQEPCNSPSSARVRDSEVHTAAIMPPQPHTWPSQRHGHRGCQRYARQQSCHVPTRVLVRPRGSNPATCPC